MAKTALRPIDSFEQLIRRNLEAATARLTCEEVGRIIGRSSRTTISKRKNDPLGMTLAELFLLCRHEHIDPADFVGGELRLKGEKV